MRVACVFVSCLAAIIGLGCAVRTSAPANQGDGQHKPRITLEDVERNQGGGARYDRRVVTLGVQDAVAGDGAGGEAGAGDAAAGEGGDEGEPAGGDEGAQEPGSVGPDDTGESDETLSNDLGDEAI